MKFIFTSLFILLAISANASLRSDSLPQSGINDFSIFEKSLILNNLGPNYLSSDIGTYVDDILAKVEANSGSPIVHYYH